jgi:hypothetical protein
MKSSILKSVMALLAVALIGVSCKKEETTTNPTPTPDPWEDYYKIGEVAASGTGLSVILYMDEEPFMGYNYVYAVVKDDVTDEEVTSATIVYEPLMDMGNMVHSSPVEQPQWDADKKAFKGAVVFIMPSANGTWTIDVDVTNTATNTTGTATFPFTVIDKPETRLISFISQSDNKKVFVALLDPRNPEVGMNDYHLAVYTKANMMSFPPISDLQIEIDPEMPTMGHGSPNNVNPSALGYGHYMGEVNFTMTGYWKVNMVIKDNMGNIMSDQSYFDITFQ